MAASSTSRPPSRRRGAPGGGAAVEGGPVVRVARGGGGRERSLERVLGGWGVSKGAHWGRRATSTGAETANAAVWGGVGARAWGEEGRGRAEQREGPPRSLEKRVPCARVPSPISARADAARHDDAPVTPNGGGWQPRLGDRKRGAAGGRLCRRGVLRTRGAPSCPHTPSPRRRRRRRGRSTRGTHGEAWGERRGAEECLQTNETREHRARVVGEPLTVSLTLARLWRPRRQ